MAIKMEEWDQADDGFQEDALQALDAALKEGHPEGHAEAEAAATAAVENEAAASRICKECLEEKPVEEFASRFVEKSQQRVLRGCCTCCDITIEGMQRHFKKVWGKQAYGENRKKNARTRRVSGKS